MSEVRRGRTFSRRRSRPKTSNPDICQQPRSLAFCSRQHCAIWQTLLPVASCVTYIQSVAEDARQNPFLYPEYLTPGKLSLQRLSSNTSSMLTATTQQSAQLISTASSEGKMNRELDDLLTNLVKQLSEQQPSIPDAAKELYVRETPIQGVTALNRGTLVKFAICCRLLCKNDHHCGRP